MQIFLDDPERAALVTDLLNTRAGFNQGDVLSDVADLTRFCAEHDLTAPAGPSELREVRALRETVVGLITDDRPASRAIEHAITVLDGLLADVPHRLSAEAEPDGGGPRWTAQLTGPPTAASELTLVTAVSLLAVVRRFGVERLRACEGDRCTGMFVDTSSNGRRRFCSTTCSSRTHVAEHRARRAAR